MGLKEDSDYKNVTVTVLKTQLHYLQKNGINRSQFLRQAIQAQKDGTFKYSYLGFATTDRTDGE